MEAASLHLLAAIITLCIQAIATAPDAPGDPGYCTADSCPGSTSSPGTHPTGKRSKKVILYWNTFFGIRDFGFGFGQQPFVDAGCDVTHCETTDDKDRLHQADAILFHMRNVNRQTTWPEQREAHQRWVFFLLEHPYHQWNDLRQYHDVFNWTMTYRTSSDVTIGYGKVTSQRHHDVADETHIMDENLLKKKSKNVAWFASNCKTNSQREKYVAELQKYIDVDVYGKCGPLKCPDEDNIQDPRMKRTCYEMLEQTYRFYLSFENIFCKEYVTEKVYNILQYQVVPVVMGGADYASLMPPHSVINVEDYPSPKHLAEHLHTLAADHKAYSSYFEWKRSHHVLNMTEAYKAGFCDLCRKLHTEHDTEKYRKVYRDVDRWWGKETLCVKQTQWDFT